MEELNFKNIIEKDKKIDDEQDKLILPAHQNNIKNLEEQIKVINSNPHLPKESKEIQVAIRQKEIIIEENAIEEIKNRLQ